MRLPLSTLLAFSASLFSVFPSLVSAIHPHALARGDHKRSPASQVLTSRQHRVARDLLDICINANVDLLADASQLLEQLGLGGLLGALDLGSKIQLCLCLKDLDIYLDTNVDIKALVGLLGKNVVSALITVLIDTSPEAQHCTFPPHSHHTCNNSDPCHHQCDPGYIPEGDTCVCAPPNISCNGVCGSFPQGCGSAVPRAMKKRTGPIVTIGQAKATCKPGQSVCGIPGREDILDFECIDTDTANDSCGGCMAPHPFFEAEPSRLSSGQDCGAISHVKSTTCVEKRCAVRTCKDGWQPNQANNECVPDTTLVSRMRRIQKRSDPISINSANTNINSNLVPQLVDVVNMVLGLPCPEPISASSPISAVTPSLRNAVSALHDVNSAAENLLSSSTASQLLVNIDVLLGTSSLLGSILHHCGCAQELGLTDATQAIEDLVSAVANLKNWCARNPIVPSSSAGGSSPSNEVDHPIVVGLNGLLNQLGVHGKSGVVVAGLGGGLSKTTNNLLDGLSLGPNNYRRDIHAIVNSDLLANIAVLVNLVVDLHGHSTLLPSPPSKSSPLSHPTQPPHDVSSITSDLVTPILQATVDVVNAQTVSLLASAIDSFVDSNSLVNSLLGQCGCVDTLGLQALVADLDQITVLAHYMQQWCHAHPIAIPAPSSPTPTSSKPPSGFPAMAPASGPVSSTISNTDDVPIVIGLSDLLTGLGVLGPVKAGVAVDGLGSGQSDFVDGLLNGLGIGPLNYKRHDTPPLSANATVNSNINSDLLVLLEALVGLVSQPQESLGLLSSAASLLSDTNALPDPALVQSLVQATGNLLESCTVSSLIANIDALIASCNTLQEALVGYGDADNLGLDYLVRIIKAALALKTYCESKPILASPSTTTTPGGLPSDSGSTPIIIGLDHLLPSLGLGKITGVATVSGLGSGINTNTSTNGVLNGVGIGPNGVRPRHDAATIATKRQDLMRANQQMEKRQLAANATVVVNSDLLAQIDALIDLILGLNGAATSTSLPPATPSSPSTPSGVSPIYPPGIDSCLVDNIIDATAALLTSSTYDDLLAEVDALVSASILSLNTLEGCACADELELDAIYAYLVKIVDATLALQDACHGHPSSSGVSSPSGPHSGPPAGTPAPSSPPATVAGSSSGGEPIIVGLTKLLQGLGLNLKADVVVDGLLGDGLDDTVDNLLNGLGIGPNGARKRFVPVVHDS